MASAVFIPAFFLKAQEQYIQSFFKQNGYIDFSTLRKIGISEPDNYVKTLFANQDVKFLSSSCLAGYFVDQMEQEVEEMFNKHGLCDLTV